ncbi:hypothetical protein D3C81_1881480 [compost metagenome]
MRPIGAWSTEMTLSKCSRPLIDSCGAGSVCEPYKWRDRAGYRVSLTSDDLPEPDTPVTHVIKPTGKLSDTFFRLLPVAPVMTSCFSGLLAWRLAGTAIFSLPFRYCAVSDFLFLRMSGRVPSAMISPPCTPAPMPMSTM